MLTLSAHAKMHQDMVVIQASDDEEETEETDEEESEETSTESNLEVIPDEPTPVVNETIQLEREQQLAQEYNGCPEFDAVQMALKESDQEYEFMGNLTEAAALIIATTLSEQPDETEVLKEQPIVVETKLSSELDSGDAKPVSYKFTYAEPTEPKSLALPLNFWFAGNSDKPIKTPVLTSAPSIVSVQPVVNLAASEVNTVDPLPDHLREHLTVANLAASRVNNVELSNVEPAQNTTLVTGTNNNVFPQVEKSTPAKWF
jgi:hypothetical protein